MPIPIYVLAFNARTQSLRRALADGVDRDGGDGWWRFLVAVGGEGGSCRQHVSDRMTHALSAGYWSSLWRAPSSSLLVLRSTRWNGGVRSVYPSHCPVSPISASLTRRQLFHAISSLAHVSLSLSFSLFPSSSLTLTLLCRYFYPSFFSIRFLFLYCCSVYVTAAFAITALFTSTVGQWWEPMSRGRILLFARVYVSRFSLHVSLWLKYLLRRRIVSY